MNTMREIVSRVLAWDPQPLPQHGDTGSHAIGATMGEEAGTPAQDAAAPNTHCTGRESHAREYANAE